jgi:antitoxin component YwqK of YwqJK toxin-antitoxin module
MNIADKIQVIDSFLDAKYCDYLESLVLNATLPLYFNSATLPIYPPGKTGLEQGEKDSPQFTHMFLDNKVVFSNHWTHVEPIQFNLFAKTGAITTDSLVKCKLNLNPKDLSFEANEHFPVHIDAAEKGITAIYYVNDSDGDTLFFDESGKVIYACTPKKGRLVYFNNQIQHAGQPPKVSPYRAVINFNWLN